MPDVFTKAKRSDVMSRIRSRGNRDTELALAKLLRAHGITGWRRHLQVRIGRARSPLRAAGRIQSRGAHGATRPTFKVRPDFVWRQTRLAVFVDGCFWHGCPKHATKPKGNAAFWRKKLAGNQDRDRRVNRILRRAGWHVVRIWECQLQRGMRNAKPGTPPVVRRIQRVLAPERNCAESQSQQRG